MLSTIIAIAGTLLGAIVTGALSHLTTARSHLIARQEQQRERIGEAVREFVRALVTYRRHAYLKINATRTGHTLPEDARTARHEAHSEATIALAGLRLMAPGPEVMAAAEEALSASLALKDADPDTVTQGPRQRSHTADRVLLDTAALALQSS